MSQELTLEMHSFALYNRISDILLIAIENGIMVCSPLLALSLWDPPVHNVQKTVSQVSQKSNSWFICTEHLGITSLLCRDIKSKSWFTRKEGGRAATPPLGMTISSRHIGHRKEPVSRDGEAAILVRQWRQTVCEHWSSFGVCSPPSYMPENKKVIFTEFVIVKKK